MEWFLLLIGIVLVVMAYTDILQTTIEHTGAGFLSSRLGSTLWLFFLKLSGRNGKKPFLNAAGTSIVISLILIWIIMIWIGFTLIFNFQVDSIIHSNSELPATFIEKFYYTGYTFSTLGNGDFKASENVWRILTIILSILGLLLITLSITYLIPLLSSVTNKRKLCAYTAFLGKSPDEIILNGWNGKDLSNLNKHFNRLSWQILDLKEEHLLYPVLHYFHSTDKRFVSPISLTILDETVSIILGSPFLKAKVDPIIIRMLRKSLDDYLDILKDTYIYSSHETPVIPDFTSLQNILDFDVEPVQQKFKEIYERRQLLKGMVEADGWKWEDIKEK